MMCTCLEECFAQPKKHSMQVASLGVNPISGRIIMNQPTGISEKFTNLSDALPQKNEIQANQNGFHLPTSNTTSPAPEPRLIYHLKECLEVKKPPPVNISELTVASERFNSRFPFPVESVRCTELRNKKLKDETLEEYINSAYPVLHEKALQLYTDFLELKITLGSEEEKSIYSNMGLCDLVQRLLEKRAVYFYGEYDNYLLADHTRGRGDFEDLGRNAVPSGLDIRKCLAYDEMKISAFLSVSSFSAFINDGNRHNKGVPRDDEGAIENDGVVIGLIGPRLEKPGYMDWQDLVVSREQNTPKNGYGVIINAQERREQPFLLLRIWSKFYGVDSHFPFYKQAFKGIGEKYLRLDGDKMFDKDVYRKRLKFSFETLLLEAQHRAKVSGKSAYVHVVGIGLGVWMISHHQEKLFLSAFFSCLRQLLPKLTSVSDVNFSWFNESVCGNVRNGEHVRRAGNSNTIRILFSRRNPHDKLPPEDHGKLLVVSYAWDSNALPGNEFWCGKLTASGDPAEAASSQIAELHNPHINNMICGTNLHIATREWGVVHISEYAKLKLESKPRSYN